MVTIIINTNHPSASTIDQRRQIKTIYHKAADCKKEELYSAKT